MTPKAVKKNLSIGKALHIIEAMAASGGPMRLQDIAMSVTQPPSTALRFLNTLMAYGYADQDPASLQYYLTMKFCLIGDQVGRQMKIRDVVRPFLVNLSRELEESTTIAIEQNFNVVYIDVFEGPDHILQTPQRIGKIAPLHGTGVGKCLLLDFDAAKIDELIRVKGLPTTTEKTIQTKKDLLAELEKVRMQGYADDDEESETGARGVAAPLRNYTGKIVAAISISGPVFRMSGEKLIRIRGELVKAAREISGRLGWELN